MRAAREHRRSAELLCQLRPAPREIMGYLYHQVAEQWLTAVLWYLDREIPATHDLLVLLAAADIGPEPTRALRRYCAELNSYVEKEAGELPEILSKGDVVAARHAAERIVLAMHEAFLSGKVSGA